MTFFEAIDFCKSQSVTLVWTWENCPFDEKYELGHGGDEDFVIMGPEAKSAGNATNHIIDRLVVCDDNQKEIDGIIFFVTAHS